MRSACRDAIGGFAFCVTEDWFRPNRRLGLRLAVHCLQGKVSKPSVALCSPYSAEAPMKISDTFPSEKLKITPP